MSEYDWSKFKIRITINADMAAVYKSWTSRQGLEKWFLRSAIFQNSNQESRHRTEFVHAGDEYEWLWFGYSDDVKERGKVISANGRDQFQFTFTANCLVTVNIYLERGEMICELIQSYIPTDEKSKQELHIGCMMGWNFYLTNLKSILEKGKDLRNKNERISNLINA